MKLLLLLLMIASPTTTLAVVDGAAAACSLMEGELKECQDVISRAFADQSRGSLTLADPEVVQRCCNLTAAGCAGGRSCPATVPRQICPAILANVCLHGFVDASSSPATATSSSAGHGHGLLIQLLCYMVTLIHGCVGTTPTSALAWPLLYVLYFIITY
ncbi:hypothetical protein ACP4OV_010385 [Aristida adscensionis]